MLQGGVTVNRHHRLRAYKRRMKERYAHKRHLGSASDSWSEIICKYGNDDSEYGRRALSYWKDYYLSGPRQYAKYATNRKLRQMNRAVRQLALQLETAEDIEDCGIPMVNADYQKYYDYDWAIW